MTRFDSSFRFQRSVLALALCAVFIPAHAENKSEDTTVTMGLGAISGSSDDRALFGQYNGLHTGKSLVGTLGVDYSVRDEEQSKWIEVHGTDLLGNTRELNLLYKDPGNWKLGADYGELTRYEPNTVNTGLLGIGSTTPQVVAVPAGTGASVDLKTKRTSMGLNFTKYFSPSLQLDLSLKREDKEGARLFGIGMNCPSLIAPNCLGTTGSNANWATLMLPEPINSSHTQVEARMGYALEKFRVSLGYYGSFYRNANATLNPNVPGSLYSAQGALLPLNSGLQSILSQPLALPPDNQAHQFDLTGSYDFTRSTRATLKLGYTTVTQNADFASSGLAGAPAGVSSLDAKLNTSLAKFTLTSRPLPQLSLLADARYEDKDDQTPIALYNIEGPTTPTYNATYTNRNLPNRKTRGKLLAAWQFTSDYRASLGADVEAIDRGVFTPTSAVSGISALRQKTDEKTINAELRRKMSGDFSGAISVSSAKRTGSNWLKDNNGLGVTEMTGSTDPLSALPATAIYMPTLADRKRDKAKVFADWTATETLSLQFSVEGGRDNYTVPSAYGLRDTRMSQASVDASYAINDNWALTGYASQGTQTLNQVRPAGYVLAYDNTSTGAGLGFTGKISGKLVVGGGLSYVDDTSVYAQTLDVLAGADSAALLAATGGLPNIVFRQTSLKLFGKYDLDKGSSLRVDLVHQRSTVSDWAWGNNGVPYTYSDGTTVGQKPNQNVTVLGVTYVYKLP